MNLFIVVLIFIVFIQFLGSVRNAFKIGYYEAKLINRGIDDSVKDMPWYKLYMQ